MLGQALVVLQHGRHGFKPNRPAEVVALNDVAAAGHQQGQLAFSFNALGHHLHAQAVGHVDEGAGDAHVLRRCGHLVHERPVDLQHVDGQLAQVAQVGVAGAEVVQRNLDADGSQLGQRARHMFQVVQQHALRHLQAQTVRVHAGFQQDGLNAPGNVGLLQLLHGQVHAHPHRRQAGRVPAHTVFTRGAQNPLAQGNDQARLLGHRNELAGWHVAAHALGPARQRLHAHDPARAQVHLRLVAQVHLLARQRMAQG